MKNRYIFLLMLGAAAMAAFLPGDVHGEGLGQVTGQDRAASRPRPNPAAPSTGVLGILQHGNWQCALPGDAGGAAFVDVPAEGFRIGTASSYINPEGSGIYLLRGNEVVFTRGPKKDQRFQRLGDNTLQKLNADGTLSKLICTRLGGAAN